MSHDGIGSLCGFENFVFDNLAGKTQSKFTTWRMEN